MHIGINALYLRPGKVGGTETYLRNLIRELILLDSKNEYILFTNTDCAHSFDPLSAMWKETVCELSPYLKPYRVFWEQKTLPKRIKELGIDVLHSPAYVSPISADCAQLVTIHDMHYHYYPDTFSTAKRFYWKRYIPKSAQRAEIVLTVSESSKKDICDILKVPNSKIKVTPEAAAEPFSHIHSHQEIKQFLASKKITSPYLLCVATFNRHKNMTGLVRAFTKMKQQYTCAEYLVLAGIKSDDYSNVITEIQKSPFQNEIHILDPIPIQELPFLYQGAELFVLLSYFEGFGLPVLEAMAGGTPVLCSNRTSLPEVAGDAAMLVDPDDESAVISALINLLQNPALRKTMSEKGKEQVKKFSWKRMAELTLSAYQDAFKNWKETHK